MMGATLDGNAVNRRLIKIHDLRSDLQNKVPNPFAADRRQFYFFSGPPHLIKTVSNCWSSMNRKLWVSKVYSFVRLLLWLASCTTNDRNWFFHACSAMERRFTGVTSKICVSVTERVLQGSAFYRRSSMSIYISHPFLSILMLLTSAITPMVFTNWKLSNTHTGQPRISVWR